MDKRELNNWSEIPCLKRHHVVWRSRQMAAKAPRQPLGGRIPRIDTAYHGRRSRAASLHLASSHPTRFRHSAPFVSRCVRSAHSPFASSSFKTARDGSRVTIIVILRNAVERAAHASSFVRCLHGCHHTSRHLGCEPIKLFFFFKRPLAQFRCFICFRSRDPYALEFSAPVFWLMSYENALQFRALIADGGSTFPGSAFIPPAA